MRFVRELRRQLEAAAACLLFFFSALHFRAEDPFFLFSGYPLYSLLVLVLTLLNGVYSGLLALAFGTALSYFFYSPYPRDQVLWLLLFGLTAAEFKFYWERKLQQGAEERDYFKEKLRDLTRNHITLKLSHERLEKGYILRPVSIRGSLKEIRNMLMTSREAATQSLLNFLASYYGVDSCAVHVREAGSWRQLARSAAGAELDLEDPLLAQALEKRQTAYFSVSDLKEEASSRYIAVLPYFEKGAGEPLALLLITEIPFLHLNKDNLLTIALYFSFFMGSYGDASEFEDAAKAYPKLDYTLFRETARLLKLRSDFGLASVFAVFNPRYGDMSADVSRFIETRVRDLDLAYTQCCETCTVLVLLPLTDYVNAEAFVARVSEQVKAAFPNFEGALGKTLMPLSGDSVKAALDKAFIK